MSGGQNKEWRSKKQLGRSKKQWAHKDNYKCFNYFSHFFPFLLFLPFFSLFILDCDLLILYSNTRAVMF